MARPSTPQRDKRTKSVRVTVSGSNNVQALKQVILDLCDVVDEIDERQSTQDRAPKSGSTLTNRP